MLSNFVKWPGYVAGGAKGLPGGQNSPQGQTRGNNVLLFG